MLQCKLVFDRNMCNIKTFQNHSLVVTKMLVSALNCFYTFLAYIIRILVEIFYSTPYLLYYKLQKSKKCPQLRDPVLLKSATELSKLIRSQQLTSEKVVSSYINRAKAVNPIINAITEERFDEALQEARKVDKLIASKKFTAVQLAQKYPLLGVPVTVKCSIAVKDMVLSSGRLFDDPESCRAKKDADAVKFVKDAGAIVLLTSSTPEFCLSMECYNNLIGVTNNPYDTRRTPGGSSGGEAAMISSGASVIGIGSDIGGSLRLPAFNCGIYGHKATARTVSIEGHYPDSKDREKWTNCFILGPMTRYAEDLQLMMKICCKANIRNELMLDKTVDLKKIKIYYMFDGARTILSHPIDSEVETSMEKVVQYFQKNSYHVEKIKIDEFKSSIIISFLELLFIDNVDDVFDGNKSRNASLEVVKSLFKMSKNTLIPLVHLAFRSHIVKLIHKKQKMMVKTTRQKLINKLRHILKDGVLLFPTTARPATFHNQIYSSIFDHFYSSVFNSLGFPATNCPIELNSKGLPIGLQVIGDMYCDRITIAFAREIERAFGGWRPPPAVEM